MATVEQLKQFGANTEEGISRCMGSEAFYLRMVGLLSKDNNFEALKKALAEDDLTTAFERAHALKGVLANLSLTPVLKPVSEMTELLRAHTETDYTSLLSEAEEQMNKLFAIL
ncbi:MAG: Hpt domain-containing protein [Oscillospiraceae bacterium]|nr:Hpt domain-containing protein [Oscillospiraceae bacterium]